MTKETAILLWLLTYADDWLVRRIDGKIIYTFNRKGIVKHIEFDTTETDYNKECDVREDRKITFFGSVEQCLEYLKRERR